MIRNVERFAAELQGNSFRYRENAGNGKVERDQPRSGQDIAARIAESAGCPERKASRVKPLGDAFRRGIHIATRYHVGPVRALAGEADVPALVWRKGAAGLEL